MKSLIVSRLDRLVADRHLLKHPFYQAWTEGTLDWAPLRNYAEQYYRHVEAFPRYLSAIHSRCIDLSVRQALLENLIDEEKGSENHPELWLRFAEGIGVPREQVLKAEPAPATKDLVDTYLTLSTKSSISAGLAALYIYESQIPAVAEAKIEGLQRHYGVTDDRSLSFFSVHQAADVYHAETGAELIARQTDADGETEILESADRALDALWRMLSSVYYASVCSEN